MTKLEKENERLQSTMTSVRKRLKEGENDLWRKGANLGTSFVVGALEKNGKLAELPTIPGVPRIVTLALVANGAAMFAPAGKMRTVLDGAGESLLSVASYKWGKGEDVAGVGETDVGGPRARANRTRTALADTSDRVRQLEAQLAAQLREEASSPRDYAPAEYIDVPAY